MKKIIFTLLLIVLVSRCISIEKPTTTTQTAATSAPATTAAGPALPDLYISDDVVLTKIATGDISVSASIWNRGSAKADNVIVSAEIKQKSDGKLIYPAEPVNKGTIGLKGSQILLKFYRLSDGSYTLTIKVDPENKIAESDESNNIFIKDFSVPLS